MNDPNSDAAPSVPGDPSSRKSARKAAPSSRKPAAPRPPLDLSGLDPLTALRAEYALALPGRVRRVGTSLRAWRRAPGTTSHYERARELAHRLRGTAGSYGFAGVGEAAGRIEMALVHTVGEPSEAHAAAWDEIWSALRDAETLADQAIDDFRGKMGAR